MRIIILTDCYPSIQRPDACAFIHARTQLYVKLGHHVLVISRPRPELKTQDSFEGISILRPVSLNAAYAAVQQFAPDVIAIHFPYRRTYATQLAIQLRDHYPLVSWIHGYETMYTAFFGYHHGLSRLLSVPHDWFKLRYLKSFLEQSSSVVFVSNWIKGLAERSMRYHNPHSIVIANPVDTELFSPTSTPPPNQQLRGIALRSLGPKYGLDIAIRAYNALEQTRLTIIGTGPLEQELRSLIRRTNSQTTLQARGFPHSEVPSILRQYDYFVAPSRNETQGLAMCEAMSCGLPVIATNVGGIPEFVRDGIDGYLVPPENPQALREAVLKLVSDQEHCRQMGQNARQHMIELCDGRRVIQQELDVLAQAAAHFQQQKICQQ
ncbi:MAG: Glycosyltransferase Gtf1 [Anaerolineae bacterium]|nr:Glycosyltransferase Gtf1 [Anaerolineae bacterium]